MYIFKTAARRIISKLNFTNAMIKFWKKQKSIGLMRGLQRKIFKTHDFYALIIVKSTLKADLAQQ